MKEKSQMSPVQQMEYILSNPLIKEEMETIWFAGDIHEGHDKIIDIHNRPTTIEEHTTWLIESVINKYVGKKHRLYLLGDVSFSSKIVAEGKFLSKLNGQKTLITGNHDRNILKSTYFSEIKQIKNFNFSRGILNIHIVLCHFPIAYWERREYGSYHVHGHTHGRHINPGLSWDAGIDNKRTLITSDGAKISHICKPINLLELCLIMSELYQSESNNIINL